MRSDPRLLALLALLALLPVVAFAIGRSTIVVLSMVCVAVIAGSLYTLFGRSAVATTRP